MVLPADLQGLYTQKQQILLQLNENTLVKGVSSVYSQNISSNGLSLLTFKELDMLEENAGVYKLVGPVLITVDIHEAKENVSKRLQFIEGEISKIEAAISKFFKDESFIRYIT